MKTKIRYVKGVEGNHVQINDMRVCGPKAWGGGTVTNEWEVDTRLILDAIASQQPDSTDPNTVRCSVCGDGMSTVCRECTKLMVGSDG